MARLVIFLSFLVGLVLVMNLRYFSDLKVDNSKFNFEVKKEANMKKAKEIEELLHPKKEVKTEVKVAEGPLVDLSDPQLAKGAELYKKCIVCHGKRGNGKASQKAPAVGGQFDWYLESQINNMRNGTRINKIMNPYIKKLTDQDVKDLAAYMSKLPFMGK